MKNNKLYEKVLFLCICFISCVILSTLLFFFNKDIAIMVNYSFSKLTHNLSNYNQKPNPKVIKEIYISALGENFGTKGNKTYLENEDFVFFPNVEIENISSIKQSLKAATANLIMGDIEEKQKNDFNIQLVTSNNMISSNFKGNKIAYLYYGGDFNIKELSSLTRSIQTLKKQNFAIVLSLKNYHSQKLLYLFSNLGVNLIFTDSDYTFKFERYENTLIVYNLNSNSKNYITNFNFIFGDNIPVGLGIKVSLLTATENKTNLLSEINKNSKGFLFEIRETYDFVNY